MAKLKYLGPALNESSYDALLDQKPLLAEAVEKEVENGTEPEVIRRSVFMRTRSQQLAAWCEAAAMHVRRLQNEDEE